LVHTILLNLTKAQICLGTINDLCTSIANLQNLQSLAELTLEQSEQLQTQLHSLAFQKACFKAHLSNNIQPLEIIAVKMLLRLESYLKFPLMFLMYHLFN
jgi:hypothetical protein